MQRFCGLPSHTRCTTWNDLSERVDFKTSQDNSAATENREKIINFHISAILIILSISNNKFRIYPDSESP